MFIELVDALRCPVPHEESWLVAAAVRMEARHIVEGTLGCPVCAAEYPISGGVVDFRRAGGQVRPAHPVSDAEQAMRLAAMLDLSSADGFAVLLGDWGAHAAQLAAIVELPLILIDPPVDVTGSPGISVLRCDGELPLADADCPQEGVGGNQAESLRHCRQSPAGLCTRNDGFLGAVRA